MMLGHVDVVNGAVVTARTSYRLDTLTVVSCTRPFLGSAFVIAVCCGGFAYAFDDLLYEKEKLSLTVAAAVAIVGGITIGQLKLLSTDLRQSELSSVVFGRYGYLNHIRKRIFAALQERHGCER